LRRSQTLSGAPAVGWRDRRRLAKKRARAIEYSRGSDNKRRLYGELISAARASRTELQALAAALAETAGTAAERWRAQVDHYLPLIARIIAQSERRVLNGEAVPASENPGSGPGLFEPHADIIVKGGRQVQYGHKLNLVTGKSGLILDVVVEAGNPADAERFLPMLDRHIPRAGAPPRQTAADGGMPATPISLPPRPAASPMSPSTKSAASPLPTWSRALGCTAGCATSAPGSRPGSPASNVPMAPHAAPGAGSTTSRPTSGPPWWPTIWYSSPASNRHS
jgi:IS5 family transposase